MSKRWARYALLAAIVLALVPLKEGFEFGLGRRAHDADYYFTIARSVAEGEGLRSNVSLYFQGFKSLPHRVTQSPVWPLALGYAGRIAGLEAASRRLPEALFYLDLLLLYFVGRRLFERVADGDGWLFRAGRVPDLGHVAVLILATNAVFFRFTSVPNHEALAFFWVFAALLALDRAAMRTAAAWAGAAGGLAALAFLTRHQMLAVAGALPLALAWLGWVDRRSRRLLPAALLGLALPCLVWALHLASWLPELTLDAFLGREMQRETPELALVSHPRPMPSLWAYVADRAAGFAVAFSPTSSLSYVAHFGALAYLVPLAGLHGLLRLARAGFGRRAARPREPRRAVLPLALLLCGVGALLPVHAAHMSFHREWLFGFRHGLPLLLLILPALAHLDARARGPWRAAAAALLAIGLATNGLALKRLLETPFSTGLGATGRELVAWLDAQQPRPAVVTPRPWELGTFSRSGYHWILCEHAPEETLRLLRHAGARYVVVYPRERRCPFVQGLHPHPLRLARSFGRGGSQIRVYELDASDARPPASAR